MASADGAKWTKDNLGTQSVDKAPFCTVPGTSACERTLIRTAMVTHLILGATNTTAPVVSHAPLR